MSSGFSWSAHPLLPGVPEVLTGTQAYEVQPVDLPRAAYYPALNEFLVEEDLAAARRQLAAAERQLAAAAPTGGAADAAAESSAERALLEQKHQVADLRLQALEARLAADRAKHVAGQEQAELSNSAARLERHFNLKEAELSRDQKQQALDQAQASEEKDEKKKDTAVKAAQKALEEADKKLSSAREAAEKTDTQYTPFGTEYPRTSSGRRLALARWIASDRNPLTARVAVNHIWLRHFGEPLVENVFDFGLRTPRPEQAELLDWLAVELMEHDWSLKHLHRLILTSRTWRRSSSPASAPAAAERDADNTTWWRAHVQRLDAEIVRDNVLAVSGHLDDSFGGPDIDFREGEKSRRRSVYLRHAYEKQMTMLLLFDAASPTECYRRSPSIQPQQALALANSSLALGASRRLAGKLWQEVATEAAADPATEFIRAAFLQILSRPPHDGELAACREFLQEQAATLADPAKLTAFTAGEEPPIPASADPQARARENLIHVLLNHNDFVSVR